MPTVTTSTRLIDADALEANLDSMKSQSMIDAPMIDYIIEKIKSAPTVETTDDVMNRLPKNFRYTFETKSDTYEVWTRDSDSERALKLGY